MRLEKRSREIERVEKEKRERESRASRNRVEKECE